LSTCARGQSAVLLNLFLCRLFALNRLSNTAVWTYTVTGSTIVTTPVLVDGFILFGAGNGILYSVRTSTGALRWSYNTLTNRILASAAVGADGTVYLACGTRTVLAINSATAALKWNFTLAAPANNAASILASTPAIGYDGSLFVGTNNGQVTVIWDGVLTSQAPLSCSPPAWSHLGRTAARLGKSAFYGPLSTSVSARWMISPTTTSTSVTTPIIGFGGSVFYATTAGIVSGACHCCGLQYGFACKRIQACIFLNSLC
jgi:outer membrane protein assembly factor BamB